MTDGIFTNAVQKAAIGNAAVGALPGFAKIASAVEVGVTILEAMTIDGGVRGGSVDVGGFDVGDFAPGSEFGRRDVGPGFTVVASELDEAIVGANPNLLGVDEGWSDGVDDAAAFGFRSIGGGGRIEIGWRARIFASEIGADGLPRLAVIGGAK